MQPNLKPLKQLNAIGVALSSEENTDKLLEMIIESAQSLTNADGGTLYLVTPDDTLQFAILRNRSLNTALGGTTGKAINLPDLPLHIDDKPNTTLVAAYSAIEQKTVNIADAYQEQGFDFSGTKAFDEKTGYRSTSFLTVPLQNHENRVIAVLQLINAMDAETGEVIRFTQEHQEIVESLASQAAVTITNHQLISDLKGLFESFIKMLADAIDEKSPYTGGHCQRVPYLTMMIADAAIKSNATAFEAFNLNETEQYELKVASWLHDCGKITTPEYVMDKATKLQTIFDRIHLVDERFELLKSQHENKLLHRALQKQSDGESIDNKTLQRDITVMRRQLDDDKNFIRKVNFGSESMQARDTARIHEIAAYEYKNEFGQSVKFLTEDEVYNLTINKGTLTPEEREVINNHIVVTIKMLESLNFPKNLARVPEYAGGHHERMDGKGYPKGLKREQMSIPARIMGVADIFEALTADDRPYKKPKTLTETLTILGKMKLNNHIDPDIFDLFVSEKLYLDYAKVFLKPSQIDDVDESKIPGYNA